MIRLRVPPWPAAAMMLGLPLLLAAADIQVGPTNDWMAIVNAASPGDIIHLAPGAYRPGRIKANGITLLGNTNGTVRMTGGLALEAQFVTLDGLTWDHVSGNQIGIVGRSNLIRRCTFSGFAKRSAAKGIYIYPGDFGGNIIEDCLFEDWGRKTDSSSCIKVGQYTARDAHRGTIIRRNVFRHGAVGGNSTAIQLFCPTLVENNLIHDVEDGMEIKGSGMVIRSNTVFRCLGGEAMSNRSGSNNLFENNLLYDIPAYAWQVYRGTNCVWRNNTMVNCGQIAQFKGAAYSNASIFIPGPPDAYELLFVSNTFVNCRRGFSWYNKRSFPPTVKIQNNIFASFSPGGPSILETPPLDSGFLPAVLEDANWIFGGRPPTRQKPGPRTRLGINPDFPEASLALLKSSEDGKTQWKKIQALLTQSTQIPSDLSLLAPPRANADPLLDEPDETTPTNTPSDLTQAPLVRADPALLARVQAGDTTTIPTAILDRWLLMPCPDMNLVTPFEFRPRAPGFGPEESSPWADARAFYTNCLGELTNSAPPPLPADLIPPVRLTYQAVFPECRFLALSAERPPGIAWSLACAATRDYLLTETRALSRTGSVDTAYSLAPSTPGRFTWRQIDQRRCLLQDGLTGALHLAGFQTFRNDGSLPRDIRWIRQPLYLLIVTPPSSNGQGRTRAWLNGQDISDVPPEEVKPELPAPGEKPSQTTVGENGRLDTNPEDDPLLDNLDAPSGTAGLPPGTRADRLWTALQKLWTDAGAPISTN